MSVRVSGCRRFQETQRVEDSGGAHLDLLPIVIIHLQHTEMMLDGHDQAMTVHQFFRLSTSEVSSPTECDNSSSRRCIILIAERTGIQRFLGLGEVCERVKVKIFFWQLVASPSHLIGMVARSHASFLTSYRKFPLHRISLHLLLRQPL